MRSGDSEPGVTVEFFHDVLCSWCYVFSPRLRRLVRELPQVRVVHRSFALAPTPRSIVAIFGSKEAGRREILQHWRAANVNDEGRRIRADLMERRSYDYPYSMPGLRACKAAEFQGGQEAHWDYFDRVQRAHLTECRNIADEEILLDCARNVSLSLERFRADVRSQETEEAVLADMGRALSLGISAVPTIVLDGRWTMSGAQPYDVLRTFVKQVLEEGRPWARAGVDGT